MPSDDAVSPLVAGRDHLIRTPKHGTKSPYHPLSPREAFCAVCGAKVTVGKSGTEYGHAQSFDSVAYGETCPHRPSAVVSSGSNQFGDRGESA